MDLIRQPEGSSLCGQACIAMVAGVSLERAIAAVGHGRRGGTVTREIVRALRSLGVECAEKLRSVNRKRPVLPKRAIVNICKYVVRPDGKRKQRFAHWMVTWDGEIYDPGGAWPEVYRENGWTITSYLEIK
jgi:hypothetical protein